MYMVKLSLHRGFLGRGEELIGLDLHDSLIRVNNNTGIAGSSYNDLTLGEMSMISSSTTYPTVNLTSNTNQGYTVLAHLMLLMLGKHLILRLLVGIILGNLIPEVHLELKVLLIIRGLVQK
ncbi:MAG: hypothetical protein Ct9H90mV1_0020 [Prasinovirus sp.]|nr:MAG: hypothetical protein Ct9H90mV1_0020 [Prasinovirus sp.]